MVTSIKSHLQQSSYLPEVDYQIRHRLALVGWCCCWSSYLSNNHQSKINSSASVDTNRPFLGTQKGQILKPPPKTSSSQRNFVRKPNQSTLRTKSLSAAAETKTCETFTSSPSLGIDETRMWGLKSCERHSKPRWWVVAGFFLHQPHFIFQWGNGHRSSW